MTTASKSSVATPTAPAPVDPRSAHAFAAALAVFGLFVVAALVVFGESEMALVALVLVPATFAILRWPEIAVPIAAFAVYTNAGVIAVKFHGVPAAIGGVVPLLFGVPVIYNMLFKGEPLLITRGTPLALLYAIVFMIGVPFALRPADAMEEVTTLLIEGLLLFILVTNAIRTPTQMRRAIWAIIAAGAFLGAVSSHQQLTKNFYSNYMGFAQVGVSQIEVVQDAEPGEKAQPRMSGPVGEENRYAQIMATLLPIALFQVLIRQRGSLRALAAIGLLLTGAGMMLTLSRGGVVAVALIFILMTLMGYVKLRYVAILTAAVVITAIAIPRYGTRILSIVETATMATQDQGPGIAAADGAVRGRVTEMKAAALMFAEHPVMGVGPGMYREHYRNYAKRVGGRLHPGTRRAHNLYLSIGAEHGMLGLGVFTWLMLVTFADLERARRKWKQSHPDLSLIAAGFMMALVAYLFTAIFLHAAYIRYFWMILAMATATAYLRTDDPETA